MPSQRHSEIAHEIARKFAVELEDMLETIEEAVQLGSENVSVPINLTFLQKDQGTVARLIVSSPRFKAEPIDTKLQFDNGTLALFPEA